MMSMYDLTLIVFLFLCYGVLHNKKKPSSFFKILCYHKYEFHSFHTRLKDSGSYFLQAGIQACIRNSS
jgi:hypothetical protein